ncbi:hypothetical protein QTP88_014124 [Uroleucon formosanum]
MTINKSGISFIFGRSPKHVKYSNLLVFNVGIYLFWIFLFLFIIPNSIQRTDRVVGWSLRAIKVVTENTFFSGGGVLTTPRSVTVIVSNIPQEMRGIFKLYEQIIDEIAVDTLQIAVKKHIIIMRQTCYLQLTMRNNNEKLIHNNNISTYCENVCDIRIIRYLSKTIFNPSSKKRHRYWDSRLTKRTLVEMICTFRFGN